MWQQKNFQKIINKFKFIKNIYDIYIDIYKKRKYCDKKSFFNLYFSYFGEISCLKNNINGWQCESCGYN